jgi:hypothetical protein
MKGVGNDFPELALKVLYQILSHALFVTVALYFEIFNGIMIYLPPTKPSAIIPNGILPMNCARKKAIIQHEG